MAKIVLVIEYEGTRYHGFQIQNDMPTIQGELQKALSKATGEVIRLYGAGRTDAGVHAIAQVATFESSATLTPKDYVRALNYYLPADIAIKDASQVEADFDPRRDAVSREYRYTILNSHVRSPLMRGWTHLVSKPLDIDKMNRAGEMLEGEHDFAPFTNKEGRNKNTVRTIIKSQLWRDGKFIYFDVVANSFLPQQVRRMIGSLMKVGLGDMAIDEFGEVVNSGEIGLAKAVAPAHGLCLMKVNYSNNGLNYENI